MSSRKKGRPPKGPAAGTVADGVNDGSAPARSLPEREESSRQSGDATMKSSMWGRVGDRIRHSLQFAGTTPHVLVAEDDDDLRSYFEIALSRAGYRVDVAINGREALQKLQEHEYDALVLDLLLPLVHGATLLADIRAHHPELLRRTVVATGLPQGALPDADGVSVILRKPFKVERLVEAVEECRKAGLTPP